MNTEAVGPEEIRSAFAFGIDLSEQLAAGITQATATIGERKEDVDGIHQALTAAADRYEQLGMAPSTVAIIREAADAMQAASTHLEETESALQATTTDLGAAGERITNALADFNAHDGAVADLVADVGNLADREVLTS